MSQSARVLVNRFTALYSGLVLLVLKVTLLLHIGTAPSCRISVKRIWFVESLIAIVSIVFVVLGVVDSDCFIESPITVCAALILPLLRWLRIINLIVVVVDVVVVPSLKIVTRSISRTQV